MIGLQLAANVKLEQKTKSSFFTPMAFKAKCIAAVPEVSAAASLDPT